MDEGGVVAEHQSGIDEIAPEGDTVPVPIVRRVVEGLTGIEPALSAWEAVQTTLKVPRLLAESLDQTRIYLAPLGLQVPLSTAVEPKRVHVGGHRVPGARRVPFDGCARAQN